MSIEIQITTCTNCQKQFNLIRNEMSWPVGTEVETYNCPYCNHKYRESIRGTLESKKLEVE